MRCSDGGEAITGLGLEEARDLVGSLPSVVKKDVPRWEALWIYDGLKAFSVGSSIGICATVNSFVLIAIVRDLFSIVRKRLSRLWRKSRLGWGPTMPMVSAVSVACEPLSFLKR